MSYPNTRSLRAALTANAIFSLGSAFVLMAFPVTVGSWLGIHLPLLYVAIGFGLVLFALDLLHQATRRRMASWRALYASGADVLWVVGSLLLVLLFPGLLSPSGTALVLAVAAIVAVFGGWQLHAAGALHRLRDGRHYRHCLTVRTDAPAEAMWRVVADLGGIARYMPSLRRSALRDAAIAGVGAVRQCEDRQGRQWAEMCTDFQPGHSFDVRFLCDEDGFPYPASEMVGGWVVQADGDGTLVRVWWELDPKPRWLAPVLLPLLAWQVDRQFPRVVAAMARSAKGDAGPAHGREVVGVRLLPEFC